MRLTYLLSKTDDAEKIACHYLCQIYFILNESHKQLYIDRIVRYLVLHDSCAFVPLRKSVGNLKGTKAVMIEASELHARGVVRCANYMEDYIAGKEPSCPPTIQYNVDEQRWKIVG